jgi:hypothetical protein
MDAPLLACLNYRQVYLRISQMPSEIRDFQAGRKLRKI